MFDTELAKHLAELSKLSFDDEELQKVTSQMGDIIKLMDMVKEADQKLETYALPAVEYANLRTDNARESLAADDIIKNAGKVRDNAFVVPKVV